MNDAQPDTATDTSSEASTEGAAKDVTVEPGPPPSEPIDDGSKAFGQMAVVVAGVTVVLALLRLIRLRRPQPTTQDRLAEATQALGTAAVGLGGRAARRTAEVAAPAAKDAAALALVAAHDTAALAAGTAHNAAELATEGVRKVGAVAAEGVREVAEGVETVQRFWHKLVTRVIVVVFGSAGYVLGARAGRERYDQITAAAQRVQTKVQGG
jgi:hypothetical protein